MHCMCDVCAAHGDRAAVGVDVDAQGSSLREDETHFPLNARVECRVCIGKNPGWFALARRKGGSIPRFPDEPVGKEDGEVRSEGVKRCCFSVVCFNKSGHKDTFCILINPSRACKLSTFRRKIPYYCRVYF